MASGNEPSDDSATDAWRRSAEHALRALGYSRVPPTGSDRQQQAEFWVQEPGVPRRRFPVFVDRATGDVAPEAAVERWKRLGVRESTSQRPAIVVVPSDRAAENAWEAAKTVARGPVPADLSILVLSEERGKGPAHWHEARLAPLELLEVATGIVVGLFRRAHDSDEGSVMDFGEILEVLRRQFHIDVHASLRVTSDEEALFILYQMALRHTYAPGDHGSNLHQLVLKPIGPAARFPWFAA